MIKDGLTIRVFSGDLRGAIKVFQRRVHQTGFIREIKKHNEFIPNTEKARLKSRRVKVGRNKTRQ
jgi:ribosomal protein S21